MKLSIVIPAYNEGKNLPACLDSVSRQTVMPDQVIVVNNNSSDDTAAVARQYNFVTVIDEGRQGIAYAHQAGFNHASGELIARIDAETVLHADWVDQVLKLSEAYPGAVLTGSGYFYNLKMPRLTHRIINGFFLAARVLLGHYPLWGPNLIIPHVAWEKVRGSLHFERDIYDDLDLALHLHAAKYPIIWCRSLKVGAQVRHCGSLAEFWRYVRRWPQTLRLHGDSRWTWAWLGLVLALPFHYGLLRALKK